jgi:pimeloyl-ACP methyl ester carboxylesterase
MFAVSRRALSALCAAAALGLSATAAEARSTDGGHGIDWGACANVKDWQCATVTVPKVYGDRDAGTFDLAVTRLPATDQAHKIGPLFINYGGPGGTAVDITQAIGERLFAPFRERFDLIAFDPRGTGATSQAIDCRANQETEGPYSQPFFEPGDDLNAFLQRVQGYWNRCQQLNPGVVPYATTGNYARDMNRIRKRLGERKLTYFGFSYGTFIGETFAALFPERFRAMVLDGALDPDQYINHPMRNLRVQNAGFEKAFGRFMMSCAAHQDFCTFGGADPWLAFDRLVERADATPIPAGGKDPRPVDGDDVLAAMFGQLYSRFAWTDLAKALNAAAAGDGTPIRALADQFYGRQEDGSYDPITDRYLALSAEQRYPDDVETYVEAGIESWEAFDHAWWNAGFVEFYWRALPDEVFGAFYGPFTVSSQAATPLVIGTRYDPATPYRGAVRAVQQMGNARLLTMNGDGHTAFTNGSDCIDAAVVAYVVDLVLPAPGTQCDQNVPFPLPPPSEASTQAAAGGAVAHHYAGPGTAPLARAR